MTQSTQTGFDSKARFTPKFYDGRIKRVAREYPQLNQVLSEAPCYSCPALQHCSDEQTQGCAKLTAWLIGLGGN